MSPINLCYSHPRGLDHSILRCPRCYAYKPPYTPKLDLPEWIEWKLTDESWQQWRDENPEEVASMCLALLERPLIYFATSNERR